MLPLARKSTLSFAKKHFEMDYGRFDRERHPMVIDILDTLDRRRGCKFMILGCIQSFKTLVATIFVLRCLQIESMKTGWYSGTKDAVKAWAEEKFNPSFDITPPIQRLLPKDKNKNQKLRKLFAHTSIQLLSANTRLDRQQKSLQMIVADECWLYEPGALGEIENRTASYPDTYRELLPSTGGDIGSEMHEIWQESDQRTWHVPCPHCHALFAYDFFRPDAIDPNKRQDDRGDMAKTTDGKDIWQPWGGIHFETGKTVRNDDEGRTINWDSFHQTVRYQCPHCGTKLKDEGRQRDAMNEEGLYIPQNPNAKRDVLAWHFNALSIRSWGLTAEKWLKAVHARNHGDTELFEKFWRMDLALFWDIRVLVKDQAKNAAYGDYKFGETDWEERHVRFMTIDVQQDHYWAVIRDWAKSVKSRLIWAGRISSEGGIKELQEKYQVKDHGNRIQIRKKTRQVIFGQGCGVFLDGNYDPSRVRRMAAQYNWAIFRGEDAKRFRHPDGRYKVYNVIELIDAFEGTASAGIHRVAEIKLANNDARNILATLQSIDHPERLWTYPQDIAEHCPDYLKHMASWVRIPKKRAKDNAYEFVWMKTSEGERDDLFWCEKAQVVAAAMTGLIGAEAEGGESTPDS